MQLQTYLRILWRRGWIMVAMAVVTAAAAFGFSLIIRERAPIYQSTARILVQPARTDLGQAQAAKQLLGPYEVWLNSTYRAAEVIDNLQLDMTPAQLLSDMRVTSDIDQLVLKLEIENPDGDVANDIAREWAQLFIQWREEKNQEVQREDRIDAELADDPVYAIERPKVAINTAAGGILGFLVGLAIVFALEYVESGIVRSPEDVSRFLDLPLLAAIPGGDG